MISSPRSEPRPRSERWAQERRKPWHQVGVWGGSPGWSVGDLGAGRRGWGRDKLAPLPQGGGKSKVGRCQSSQVSLPSPLPPALMNSHTNPKEL